VLGLLHVGFSLLRSRFRAYSEENFVSWC
jgi:hypothetical protein